MDRTTTLWWPIRIAWARPIVPQPPFCLGVHRWQVGWRGIGHGLFGITLHFGSVKIMCGPRHRIAPVEKS